MLEFAIFVIAVALIFWLIIKFTRPDSGWELRDKEQYKAAASRQAERLNNPHLKRNTVYRLCTRCDGYVEPRGGSAGYDGHVNPVGMATKVAGGVVLTAIPIVGWVMGPLAILGAGKKSGAVGPTPPHGVCLKCDGKYDSANFAVLKAHALAR